MLGAQLHEISRKEDELTRQVTALAERLAAKERFEEEYERRASGWRACSHELGSGIRTSTGTALSACVLYGSSPQQ